MRTLALYARVSTDDQSVAAQLHELRAYAERAGAEVVEYVDEGVSGRKTSRPRLDELLAAARRREISAVVVVRLDRLARSLVHMAGLGEELRALDIDLISLTEGIDTTTPTGRALFGMCGVFAQLEADLIRDRTIAGIAQARRNGKRLGRPPVLDADQVKRARRLRVSGHSTREIARLLEIGQTTVRRVLGPLG